MRTEATLRSTERGGRLWRVARQRKGALRDNEDLEGGDQQQARNEREQVRWADALRARKGLLVAECWGHNEVQQPEQRNRVRIVLIAVGVLRSPRARPYPTPLAPARADDRPRPPVPPSPTLALALTNLDSRRKLGELGVKVGRVARARLALRQAEVVVHMRPRDQLHKEYHGHQQHDHAAAHRHAARESHLQAARRGQGARAALRRRIWCAADGRCSAPQRKAATALRRR